MFMLMAFSELSTPFNMATPCSVKAYGRYLLCCPLPDQQRPRRNLEVTQKLKNEKVGGSTSSGAGPSWVAWFSVFLPYLLLFKEHETAAF
jgi:hypothetical protein